MRLPVTLFRPRRELPPPPAPACPAPLLSGRPTTILGFLSDLSRDRRQARTFVFMVGSVMVLAVACFAACFAACCFVIMVASREVKGIPAETIVSAGIGGASLTTFVTTLIVRYLKRWISTRQSSGTSE
jgi:hypothetical protein